MFGYFIPLITTGALLFIGEKPLMYKKTVLGEMSPMFIVLLLQNILLGHLNFSLIMRHVTNTQFNPLANKVFIFTNLFSIGIIITSFVTGGKLDILTWIYVMFVL